MVLFCVCFLKLLQVSSFPDGIARWMKIWWGFSAFIITLILTRSPVPCQVFAGFLSLSVKEVTFRYWSSAVDEVYLPILLLSSSCPISSNVLRIHSTPWCHGLHSPLGVTLLGQKYYFMPIRAKKWEQLWKTFRKFGELLLKTTLNN